jgi:hypothetical protein
MYRLTFFLVYYDIRRAMYVKISNFETRPRAPHITYFILYQVPLLWVRNRNRYFYLHVQDFLLPTTEVLLQRSQHLSLQSRFGNPINLILF